MESRSAGCATATGVAVRMQPDKASAAVTAMIGSRNARATRTGTIPQSETALVLHRLWLTNRFLELSPRHPESLTKMQRAFSGSRNSSKSSRFFVMAGVVPDIHVFFALFQLKR